jgi:hypothetical protein
MALGVYCECGLCLPVVEDDAGSSLLCSCGRRVVVPLLDEFRDHPVLLSEEASGTPGPGRTRPGRGGTATYIQAEMNGRSHPTAVLE